MIIEYRKLGLRRITLTEENREKVREGWGGGGEQLPNKSQSDTDFTTFFKFSPAKKNNRL